MTKHIAGFILFSFILGTTVFASIAIRSVSSSFESANTVPAVETKKKRKKRKKRKRRYCRKSYDHHRFERFVEPVTIEEVKVEVKKAAK